MMQKRTRICSPAQAKVIKHSCRDIGSESERERRAGIWPHKYTKRERKIKIV